MTSKKAEEEHTLGENEEEREMRRFLKGRLDGLVPDTMKKMFFTSLGALFLTEDSIRTSLNELKIPKDMVGYLVSQSSKSKKELYQAIAREFAGIFASADMEEVLRNALSGMTVEMEVKINFSSRKEGAGAGDSVVKIKKIDREE